jgi:EF-hand domain-containing protein 1
MVVGQDLYVFAKRIRLTSCNQYTREFYEVNGTPQPPNTDSPTDNFEKNAAKPYFKPNYNRKSELEGEPVKSQKQFLENDRKVLKFYCESGKQFIIHYYLADDTIDIVDVHYQNDSMDPFPKFLNRQKLPRKHALNQPGQTYSEDFLKAEHFSVRRHS